MRKINNDTTLKILLGLVGILLVLSTAVQFKSSTNLFYVVFNSDGGSAISSQTIKENHKASIPNNPTKEGYEFLYWELNGDKFDFTTAITKDIKLNAVYELVSEYTVTFNYGERTEDVKITSGILEKPEDPKKETSKFLYWDFEGKEFDFESQITKNMTLVAIYEDTDKFVVKFDDGDKIKEVIVTDGTIEKPEDPIKEGNKFVYWENGSKEFDFSKKITENLLLKAMWEQLSYTIKFDSKGGTLINNQTVANDTIVIKPNNPTREGYSFIGWYSGNEEYSFKKGVERDLVLVARWKEDEPESVTKTETKKEVLKFSTKEENDPTLEVGKTSTKQEGINGEQTITYSVTYVDGKETTRTEVSRKTTKQPVVKIINVGTKEKTQTVITKENITVTDKIPFKTITVGEDPTLAKGQTKIVKEGENGILTTVYEVTFTNGIESNREMKSQEVIKEPVTREIVIGTNEADPTN